MIGEGGDGTATNKTVVKFVAGLTESTLMRTWCAPCARRLHENKSMYVYTVCSTGTCMHWSLSAYRQYTFYHTDVDRAIQTVIQTVGIYGTDVQTVTTLKAFNF